MEQLDEHGSNLWESFSEGLSPKRLLRHPVFWSLDRMKCFMMDLADARNTLGARTKFPKLSGDWVEFVKKSLSVAFRKAKIVTTERLVRMANTFEGDDIVDLVIFTPTW